MKFVWTDKRLFMSVLGLIGAVAFPPAAPYVVGLVGGYLANRAYSDPKGGKSE